MALVSDDSKVGFPADIVPGVFVEVLWDAEEINQEDRRRERSVTSAWWRAEVTRVEQISGKCKAGLRYDCRGGFKEQVGEVWVFPRHIRLVGDDTTQLCWRFYECFGEVTYEMDEENETNALVGRDVASFACETGRVAALEDQLGKVLQQFETIEQFVVAQNHLFSRLLGAGSTSERQCAQLLSTLRQRVALLMQRPIPPSKLRKDNDEKRIFFEENSSGILSVDVDCDLQTFAATARVVKSKMEMVCFRPCFTEIQLPGPALEEAEIVFSSFDDLSRAIGIDMMSGVLRMTLREKGNCKKLEKGTGYVAVRVVGTYLIDTEAEESAMAIMVGKSVHEESLYRTLDAVVQESREFDFSTRTYRKPLLPRSCTGKELMKTVFSRELNGMNEPERTAAVKEMSSRLRHFTIRWQELSSPNSRTWSRKLAVSEFFNGIVRVEFLVSSSEDQILSQK